MPMTGVALLSQDYPRSARREPTVMGASGQTMTADIDLEDSAARPRMWIRANLEPKAKASVRTAPRTETKIGRRDRREPAAATAAV